MSVDLPDLSGLTVGKYRVVDKKGEGNYGVTYKAEDTALGDRPVAIKFLKPDFTDTTWKKEALRAAAVSDVPQIAFIIEVGEKEMEVGGQTRTLRYLVWEYVDGEPLEKHLTSPGRLAAGFIVGVIKQLCLAIRAMQGAKLQHGDLHARNILLIPPKPYESPLNYRLKVVDFGLSQTFRGERFRTDLLWVAKLLEQFWEKNKTEMYHLDYHDKRFTQAIPNVIKRLQDTSLDRKLIDAMETIRELERISEETRTEQTGGMHYLSDPFEYLSAEQMPENTDLLYFLYSGRLPWFKELEQFGNVVVSGPRGCGKSMVLKNLRLYTKLMSEEYRKQLFGTEGYIGLYVHCHNDVYLPFAGKDVDYSQATTLASMVHYINLLFTDEALCTLIALEQFDLVAIPGRSKDGLAQFVCEKLLRHRAPFVEDMDLFSYLRQLVQEELIYVQNCVETKAIPAKVTHASYPKELCSVLKGTVSFFRDKHIYYILDDYSMPKVPLQVQKSFNRVLGVRSSEYCFKISTEKFSFVPTDYDLEPEGKEFQEGREFSYIDLGGRYLSYPRKKDRKEFIQQIVDKRLQRTRSWAARDCLSIYGLYDFPAGDIASSLIRDRLRGKGRRATLYAGMNVIYSLCGGDVYTILEVCRDIFHAALAKGKFVPDSMDPIPFLLQDRIVREFSQSRLERIKEIENHGNHLFRIVEVFGEIAQKYLYEYGRITRDEGRHYEVMRIEVRGNTRLSEEAFGLYKLMLQAGIFTDAGGRYPWGRGVLNDCFILRPIYTPALKISYRKRECLRLSTARFEKFLVQPDQFQKQGTNFLRRLLSASREGMLFKAWDDDEPEKG
ncbi:MAG TPA: protein kinase [Planctomycetota bacterium]|nr:protein kinase [Planctomycetota bacterium]